ncbi:hypothetical protein [Corynebacterium lipophiloflavum]|uniref:Uncharacterized protein n=1 Tax=Corynebacterium lipophiloflavum (strain ATCC 700352 / DSM 44291 / CCUG 37336 / JCM 10383 / DMMZ 1944) TaxID=525263 RepID=C0XTY9_CORLD|nr:hypothetical protein [Corynebacterium lipophiloflavum]EEI16323.1 hypothetical protein HMPREF0298_1909 [Corynebacterium lipophiloflavum DSM 44291]
MSRGPEGYWPANFVTGASELVDVNTEQLFLAELLELERFYNEKLPLPWRDALQELIGQVEKAAINNEESNYGRI